MKDGPLKSDTALMSVLAGACIAVACYVAIRYAWQVPLDAYSFRQTQTALTAFWLQRNGFSLAYETPVAGPPWSLPFEFPIYQSIVAFFAALLRLDLNATGRLVSFTFLIAIILPVRSIVSNLVLSPLVLPIFCALLFSSPLYMYWGRTFMIETTALFFCVAAIGSFVKRLQNRNRWSGVFLALWLTLGLLQKITTALPVLVTLFTVFLWDIYRRRRQYKSRGLIDEIFAALFCFGIPLCIGAAWTIYAEEVRHLNPLGARLTSDALRQWNWGTWEQRTSQALYVGVIASRIFVENVAGYIGAAVLIFAMILRPFDRSTSVVLISLCLGFLPVFLFPNLHIVHDYYESGNLIFILFAVAVALGGVIAARIRRQIVVFAIVVVMVISNGLVFSAVYLPTIQKVYQPANSQDLALARVIEAETSPGQAFVAFGYDWNSSLAYFSQRRSFTAPALLVDYAEDIEDPTRLIARSNLGAVVMCPRGRKQAIEFLAWPLKVDGWKIGALDACYIAVPEKHPLRPIDIHGPSTCTLAAITTETLNSDASLTNVEVTVLPDLATTKNHDTYYVDPAGAAAAGVVYEMLDVTRSERLDNLPGVDLDKTIYSRLIATSALVGEQGLRILRLRGEELNECRAEVRSGS